MKHKRLILVCLVGFLLVAAAPLISSASWAATRNLWGMLVVMGVGFLLFAPFISGDL